MHHEIRVERLLGKHVMDSAGQSVGRIEEIQVEQQHGDWVVARYLLGPSSAVQRLLRMLSRHRQRRSVAWHELDLADPEHPRLRGPRDVALR